MQFFIIILSILAGSLFPVQGAVNGVLREEVGNPFLSGSLSNLLGMIIMLVLVFATTSQFPLSAPETNTNNWYMWTGGIISALVVSANIVIPKYIGFSKFLAIYMVSQLVMSVLIDHFGLFGSNQQPISLNIVIGVLFLAIGIFFIVFK